MFKLHIDIETYSGFDLKACGNYRYCEHPEFEILLFAYSVDGSPVRVVSLSEGEQIPAEILAALTDPTVQKWAFNATFERIALSRYLKNGFIDPESWYCTMVQSAYNGYPLSLGAVSDALQLESAKMSEGRALIKYFCNPCNPTKANGGRMRNRPIHDMEKWATFKEYCKTDVLAEMEVHSKTKKVPASVWDEYFKDGRMNDRGVRLDMEFVASAIDIAGRNKYVAMEELRKLTGLANPNSATQLKEWLSTELGETVDSVAKDSVKELKKTAPKHVNRVLQLRQLTSKSSVAKYVTMENCKCDDGRTRGQIQFYGASRTGRAAGRLVQVHNLPKNHMKDLGEARKLVHQRRLSALDMLYESIPDVLSQLIRTSFVPAPGKKFLVADFSSIEAIILGYLAGEKWVIDAYAADEDLYVKNAETMFKQKPGTVSKKSEMRQKSKIAVLACGYGGSVGALINFGALEMGLQEHELRPLVYAWRAANPAIVKYWYKCNDAAMQTVREGVGVDVGACRFHFDGNDLFITLPRGRKLAYVGARIDVGTYGDCVFYKGGDKWTDIESSPGKWVENIVQAFARDILYHALNALEGLDIVMHVHDEVVIEVDENITVEDICERISNVPEWAAGMPLRAEGFLCEYYQKD